MIATAPPRKLPPDPYYVDSKGDLRFRAHDGQRAMMAKTERFILTLAGTQSGKTVSGPWWLLREICQRGPGDYLVAAPTYPLMQKKVMPEFRRLFGKRLALGDYKAAEKTFVFSEDGARALGFPSGSETLVFFGHAQDPDSLESATAKAAWLDESGQRKFKASSWEAIQRRLSIHQGRVLFTTTPYVLGWLKDLHDEAQAAQREGRTSDTALVSFESTMNPAFPQAEYERMRGLLPAWKFDMMYRGRFTRPAGLIYDCYSAGPYPDGNTFEGGPIQDTWDRVAGVDFGGTNTAHLKAALQPTPGQAFPSRLWVYTEALEGGKTAAEHTATLRAAGDGRTPDVAWGGAPSETDYRREWTAAGMRTAAPAIRDLEAGISHVYALLKTRHLVISDECEGLLDEIETYARELDDRGEATERIADKSTFHRLDALRYLCAGAIPPVTPTPRRASSVTQTASYGRSR